MAIKDNNLQWDVCKRDLMVVAVNHFLCRGFTPRSVVTFFAINTTNSVCLTMDCDYYEAMELLISAVRGVVKRVYEAILNNFGEVGVISRRNIQSIEYEIDRIEEEFFDQSTEDEIEEASFEQSTEDEIEETSFDD